MIQEFLRKMERQAEVEAIHLRRRNSRKLQLIGSAIGIFVVILIGIWIAFHP